jgi:hypothetical protein
MTDLFPCANRQDLLVSDQAEENAMTNQITYETGQSHPTDTIEDLEFLAHDARSWARTYANSGDWQRARIEREAAESFEAEIARRQGQI